MTKRLQVLLDEQEMKEIRKIARLERMTVAEWVRQALRLARREHPIKEQSRKLAALRSATAYSFPTANIDQMLAEIERGYSS